MVRIITADDGEYERDYLRTFIENNYTGVASLCYEAKDGAELIEKALELRPQIILMDIKMPKLDGLEAARQLKKKLPGTELVIISAYGQFEYAQKAIRLGVKDYLVKPYLDEELKETLNRLLASMKIDDRVFSDEEQGAESDELYEDVEGEIIWKLAFNDRINPVQEKDLLMRGIHEKNYKCIVLSHRSILDMGSAGCGIVKNLLSLPHSSVLVNYFFGQMIVYMFFDEDISYSSLNSAIKRVREYLGSLDDSAVYCGVSGTYSDPEKSRTAFEEAEGYIADYSDAHFSRQFTKALESIRLIQELAAKLAYTILGRNRELVHDYSERILAVISCMSEGDSRRFDDIRRVMLLAARKINYQSGKRILSSAAMAVCRLCDKAAAGEGTGTLEEIWYKGIAILQSSSEENAVYGNTMIVKKAREYIEMNFSQPISQQNAADELGVSAGYLGKNYRMVEGMSFTEYLLKVRLDKSKELMSSGALSLADIAERVGFSDPGYFSKCFKKAEGIAPSEYAEILKRQKNQDL